MTLFHQSGENDGLCARCVAIHITEGQIPAICSACKPPRGPNEHVLVGLGTVLRP